MVSHPSCSVSSTFSTTTPTHPRLQTTLSPAGCHRLAHFIDNLTDYLLGPDLDRHPAAMSCYTSLSTPVDHTSCTWGSVWLGLEQHNLCTGISANKY